MNHTPPHIWPGTPLALGALLGMARVCVCVCADKSPFKKPFRKKKVLATRDSGVADGQGGAEPRRRALRTAGDAGAYVVTAYLVMALYSYGLSPGVFFFGGVVSTVPPSLAEDKSGGGKRNTEEG